MKPAGASSDRRGYTLVELLVAISLSAIVMSGIISVASSVIRYQVEGGTRGDVAGWTLMNLHRMNQELEAATFITTRTTNGLIGCHNFSRILKYGTESGKYDTTSPITWFHYCAATVSGIQSLYRYEDLTATTCPDTAKADGITCGNAPGGALTYALVARRFYHHDEGTDNPPFFQMVREGIEMHYTIGESTPVVSGVTATTPYNPVPVYLRVDTTVGSGRTYNNGSDADIDDNP